MKFYVIISIAILLPFVFTLPALADSFQQQQTQLLSNPPVNRESQDAVFYSEKIFDSDGNLFSEGVLGTPWERDENNKVHFLNNRQLSGPNGEYYSFTAGTDSISQGDTDYGYRTFYSILPHQGRLLNNRNEFEQHLWSMNIPDDEIIRIMDAYDAPPNVTFRSDTIESSLSDLIQGLNNADTVRVIISFEYNPPLELPSRNAAVDAGLPLLGLQKSIERLRIIEQRKIDFASHQEPTIQFLEANGAANITQFWINNYIATEVPAGLVQRIAALSGIRKIELNTESVPDGEVIKPPFARKTTQAEMFVDYNFDGLRGQSSYPIMERVRVGVGEKSFFETNHQAFLDTISGPTRVIETFNCNCNPSLGKYCDTHDGKPDEGCDPNAPPNECSAGYRDYCFWSDPVDPEMSNEHATSVLGIIAASCMEDECSLVDPSEWETKSGMSPNVAILTFNSTGNFSQALQHAIIEEVNVFNYSMSTYSLMNDGNPPIDDEKPVCPDMAQATGRTQKSIDVNSAFHNGIFFSKSAGNNRELCTYDHGMGWVCSIGNPGAAAGAFTVGAYYSYFDDPYNYFEGSFDLAEYSSAGMTYDYRTKPDVVAPTNIACLPQYFDQKRFFDCTYPYDISPLGGTSAATPVVSGAAANLLDWMMYNFGSSITNYPGHLFANMINFGDRVGTDSTGYFHPLNGAGRLRVRLPTSKGMDSTYHYRTHRVLFFPYGTVSYNLGINDWNIAIPNDTEILKIAVWWYDPEIELENGGAGTAKFIMTLENLDQGTSETVSSFQVNPRHEEQKMQMIFDSSNPVFDNLQGGDRHRLTVTNVSMATTYPLVNHRILYITYFWEDADRDDLDCAPCSDMTGPTRCRCTDTDNDYLFYR